LLSSQPWTEQIEHKEQNRTEQGKSCHQDRYLCILREKREIWISFSATLSCNQKQVTSYFGALTLQVAVSGEVNLLVKMKVKCHK
jgi:hypothetical protein